MKKRIIVYHDNLFGDAIGGTEKFLHDFIRVLSASDLFDVFAVYGKNNGEVIPADLLSMGNCTLLPFTYSYREKTELSRLFNMKPDLEEILSTVDPHVFICVVWASNQFPILNIPRKIPVFLISPFHYFCSNGNVRKLYLAGNTGKLKLWIKGVWFAERFISPLTLPVLNNKKLLPKSKSEQIVFGRSGRPHPDIFDPISILAFARLEKEYGDRVKYIYVNPPPQARELVKELKLQQVEFREWLSEEELRSFYQGIDVFAHARCDGETLGVAIAEALLAQNPVITHVSRENNDHMFMLKAPFGKIAGVDDWQQYYEFMKFFVEHRDRLPELGRRARDFVAPYFDKDRASKKIVKDVSEAASYYGKPRLIFDRIYSAARWVKKTGKMLCNKLKSN